MKNIQTRKPNEETVGPSDNTGVKGTVRNDKAMKEKFSELLVLAFPDERLQGSLSQRCQRSWIKVKEIHSKVRPSKYVIC